MNRLTLTIASILMTGLAACGGGGGDGAVPPPPPPPPPNGGIGRTGVAIGPIANFGSIIVNGVEYDTETATFSIDGEIGSQADLRVGDIVAVRGTVNDDSVTGTADEVFYDDIVTGPVTSIDLATSTLTVLGQQVLVRAETLFDDDFSPASIEGVSLNQVVEVSGQFDANGNIVASRIEPEPAGVGFEVHGFVTSLDAAALTFSLNALVVDYSGAQLDDFPGGQIREGDFVEAEGNAFGSGGELIATEVEFEDLLGDIAEGDWLEIEGFITRFVSATDFDVAGFPVTTTSATEFDDGSAADLGLNVKVEVEGDIDANGVLVATEIEIRRAKAVRATATLDSVDAADSSVVMLGITVRIDALTRIEDKSDAEADPLTPADLNAGDYVEVRGDEFPAGSGEILATIFEREDPDTEAILQGFVETPGNPNFVILGVTIETGSGTVFRDENDVVLSAADFFDRLADGDLVKAQGVESSDTVIAAEEVEFELEF